jgi:hypothetical protein
VIAALSTTVLVAVFLLISGVAGLAVYRLLKGRD